MYYCGNLHYEKFSDGSVKCIEDEIPFELPDGWAWARLGTVVTFVGGYAYKSNRYVQHSNNLLIRIGNVKNNSLTPHVAKTCISDEYAAETSGYRLRVNDILFTMTGTRGKRDYFFSCLIKKEDLSGANLFLNQRVGCLRLIDTKLMIPDYFVEAIQSSCVLDAIFATETGNVNQGNIGSTATLNLLIPVPPTSEQYKIFERTYSLISSIDQCDIESAELLCLIHAIKSKILDLAIRGQLVPQAPADEPASVLLERIRAEKEELIRQGKIKRDKKESVIFRGEDNSYYEKIGGKVENISDEIPFELPEGWAWCRGYSCFEGMESTKPQGDFFDYIDIDAIDNRLHCIKEAKHLPVSDAPSRASRAVKDGSVLFSLVRPYLENIALVEEKHSNCIASTGFYVCNSNGVLLPEFMFFLMISGYVVNGLNQYMKGDNSPSISKDNIGNWLYPAPPVGEQQTICAKLKTVFTLVENVEKSLN